MIFLQVVENFSMGFLGKGQARGPAFSSVRILLVFLVMALLTCSCDESKGVSATEHPLQPEKHRAAPAPWAARTRGDTGFPCDVEEVLAQSCRRCHWEPQENDAPFPLVVHADTQKMRSGKTIFVLMEQMVSADLMPPLDALVTPDVTPLTKAQKSTLLVWLRAGAKRQDAPCKP